MLINTFKAVAGLQFLPCTNNLVNKWFGLGDFG